MKQLIESEIWKAFCDLSLTVREDMIDRFRTRIEKDFDCKVVDKPFTELGKTNNPCLSVQDSIRNICYLKEFIPNQN